MSKKSTPAADATDQPTRKVRFDTPGVRAIGPYKPGTDYELPAAEAERLVKTKGFHYCDQEN